jgi:2-succinyl-6-hydroxy-2,4-cyclohexadiene-1-carboxylate synthase
MPAAVVLLHGFAGTGHAWDAVAERLGGERYLAPDIRGHGAAAAARPIGFEECTADVLAAAPASFELCGYSMGGRLALHVALAAPERIARLVLVSATAGIEDVADRARRRAADERLAGEIQRMPLADFADRWLAQPLFADDGDAARMRGREDILRNEPAGLAAALRGIGAGSMLPLWNRLGELEGIETLVVAGERDARYVHLGERLADVVPRATMKVIPGAGHALPRECPDDLAALLV